MALEDDLNEAYFAGRTQTPHFEEVYNAIRITKTKHTAQLYLSSDDESLEGSLDGSEDESKGRIGGNNAIKDPVLQQPYDLSITSIETDESLAFTFDELMQFPERDLDASGPGMTAQVELAGDHHGVVTRAESYIKLVRVWTKIDANGKLQELFEGYFEIDVSFALKYAKEVGFKETQSFSFWAVRA